MLRRFAGVGHSHMPTPFSWSADQWIAEAKTKFAKAIAAFHTRRALTEHREVWQPPTAAAGRPRHITRRAGPLVYSTNHKDIGTMYLGVRHHPASSADCSRWRCASSSPSPASSNFTANETSLQRLLPPCLNHDLLHGDAGNDRRFGNWFVPLMIGAPTWRSRA